MTKPKPTAIETAQTLGMTRADILHDAGNAVLTDRDEQYGSPEDSFSRIADLWNAYRGHTNPEDPEHLKSWDVATMLALLKVARISRNPGHRDSWVDLAGYAACGAEAWANKDW